MRAPVNLTTPRCWEPEEALAVWELLTELADVLWTQHEASFTALLVDQKNPDFSRQKWKNPRQEVQLDLFDPDDDLPF